MEKRQKGEIFTVPGGKNTILEKRFGEKIKFFFIIYTLANMPRLKADKVSSGVLKT